MKYVLIKHCHWEAALEKQKLYKKWSYWNFPSLQLVFSLNALPPLIIHLLLKSILKKRGPGDM